MADVKALAENLVGLTVKEVQELAEFFKKPSMVLNQLLLQL